MNLEELGPSWQKQNDSRDLLRSNLLTGVIRRAERGRLMNWLLGIVGVVASLGVVWDFGHLIFQDPSLPVRAGAAMCVLGALGLLPTIVLAFWPSRSAGQSTCDYFSQELRRTQKRIASNKSPYGLALIVLVAAGACLIAIGGLPAPRAVLMIAMALAISIGGWWGGRIYVRRDEQLCLDFEELLAEFRQETSAT